MNPRHREILRENHMYLTENLDLFRTNLLDYLYSDKLLSDNDVERLEKQCRSTVERTSQFLREFLPRKGPDAFEKFIRALVKADRMFVAEKLDKQLADKFYGQEEDDDDPIVNKKKRGNEKALLRDNHSYLVVNLDLRLSSLCDQLLHKKLITYQDQETIEGMTNPWDRARYLLLGVLPRRGPDTIKNFMEVLQNTDGQKHIADALQHYLGQKDEMDTGVDHMNDEAILKYLIKAENKAFRQPVCYEKQKLQEVRQGQAYPMSRRVRGRAVIINNRYFMKYRTRDGAEHDEEELGNLFKSLHFDVKIHSDKNAAEIEKLIQSESQGDHSNYDAFVLFILTHGKNGYIVGTDENLVKIDDIVRSISNCATLNGKPKMFFIQACRVDDKEEKANDCTDAVPQVSYGLSRGDEEVLKMKKSSHRDIIIAYSTLPGCYAYRKEDSGSVFVRYFVHVCSISAHNEDLTSMLLRVNRLLERWPSAAKHEQMSESVLKGLLKKIYFFPQYFE